MPSISSVFVPFGSATDRRTPAASSTMSGLCLLGIGPYGCQTCARSRSSRPSSNRTGSSRRPSVQARMRLQYARPEECRRVTFIEGEPPPMFWFQLVVVLLLLAAVGWLAVGGGGHMSEPAPDRADLALP